ncbi:MAG: hypothetical protein EHM49_03440 [Deltaproteobacteria bacterium]|nr:MAG: hypothetical protein EHM49_03440 [Deltaproteobacteria bacterium]
MARSIVGIINLALSHSGIAFISTYPDITTPQGITATALWDYILDEVLEAKDWRFAKKRYKMALSTTVPIFTWDYAYPLPDDFLRLCRGSKDDPAVYPLEVYGKIISPWAVEALEDDTLCLMTNFSNASEDIYISYIARIVDPKKYSALFIKALSLRLGAQISVARTKDPKIFSNLMGAYRIALNEAESLNQSLDSEEKGNSDWEDAGR